MTIMKRDRCWMLCKILRANYSMLETLKALMLFYISISHEDVSKKSFVLKCVNSLVHFTLIVTTHWNQSTSGTCRSRNLLLHTLVCVYFDQIDVNIYVTFPFVEKWQNLFTETVGLNIFMKNSKISINLT